MLLEEFRGGTGGGYICHKGAGMWFHAWVPTGTGRDGHVGTDEWRRAVVGYVSFGANINRSPTPLSHNQHDGGSVITEEGEGGVIYRRGRRAVVGCELGVPASIAAPPLALC